MRMVDRTELLKAVIAHGAFTNLDKDAISSALYMVVTKLSVGKDGKKQNILPLVKVLLQNGADPDFVYDKRIDIFKTLMIAHHFGMRYHPRLQEDDQDPLIIAAIKFSDADVLQALLDAGGHLDCHGINVLQACIESKGSFKSCSYACSCIMTILCYT